MWLISQIIDVTNLRMRNVTLWRENSHHERSHNRSSRAAALASLKCSMYEYYVYEDYSSFFYTSPVYIPITLFSDNKKVLLAL